MGRAEVSLVVVALLGGLGAADGGSARGGAGGLRAPAGAEAARAAGGPAVEAYWTPERMRSARAPAPGAGNAGGAPAVPAVARAVPPVAPATGAGPAGAPRGRAAGPARAVGKVFYRHAANGRDYSCSAWAVNSGSGNLVGTAGHCVHDGRGGWHRNWVFVPSFDRGRRPHGTWRAAWLVTFTDWAAHGRSGRDVAFVKVLPSGGRRLTEAVGGNGIRTGVPSRTRRLTIIGYPFLPPYPGDRQYRCAGVTAPAGPRLRMACPLTTGASGGPWLEGPAGSTGAGYVHGVTTNTDLANTTLWSPYFDDGVWNLYRYADRL